MSYGFGPYGLGPYGSTLAESTISVASAWAISTHGVRVTLTGEPAHEDPFAPGDALNASTWTVVDVTTSRTITVVAAEMFDDNTVDLTTLEALGDHLETHEVTAVGLFTVDGFEAEEPLSAQFVGVVTTVDPTDVLNVIDLRDRDLANPPFQVNRGLGFAGTLVYGSDGDLVAETGVELIHKLVLRRMTTRRGAFPWLPNYGVGIVEKEPLASGGDLVAALVDIEDQAKQEPDVVAAKAGGLLDRSGVLVVMLSVTASDGATLNMRLRSASGRLVEG